MVATAIIGSALIGGAATIVGSQSAASAQTAAADKATAAQMEMFNKTQANLQPYVDLGKEAINPLVAALPELSSDINLDQNWLENTPGYKFTLAQGNKSLSNAMAARGLGSSGAALKGASEYTTGLANNTYAQQLNNELAIRQQRLGALTTPVTIGESAGASLGTIAQGTGQQVGSNAIGAGNAQAGADIATGNAVANTGNALVSSILAKNMFPTAGATTGVYSPSVTPYSGTGGYY